MKNGTAFTQRRDMEHGQGQGFYFLPDHENSNDFHQLEPLKSWPM